MLGVRLDPETEARLRRFANRRRRPKSDVARQAILEYLNRHDFDEAEFRRQLRVAAAIPTEMDELLDLPFTEFDD